MKSANVQNHSNFTIDFEDFTEATKFEKHEHLLETLQVLHYKRAGVDAPKNVCKKPAIKEPIKGKNVML